MLALVNFMIVMGFVHGQIPTGIPDTHILQELCTKFLSDSELISDADSWCSKFLSNSNLETTAHDNQVFFTTFDDVSPQGSITSFSFTKKQSPAGNYYSVSSGQPFDGVSSKYNADSVFGAGEGQIDVEAGRHHTSEVATWFDKNLQGGECFGLGYFVTDSKPESLNFAIYGDISITFNGVLYTLENVVIGQGYNGSNNWWFGGKDWRVINEPYIFGVKNINYPIVFNENPELLANYFQVLNYSN